MRNKSFAFHLRILLSSFLFLFFVFLVTDTWKDLHPLPIPWPLLSPLNVNGKAFCNTVKSAPLLSSQPVRSPLFWHLLDSFLLPGHMGQIKGAFPLFFFFFTAAGLNHQAVAKHRAGCRSVGRVSPDEAWETFLINCANISMKHPLWSLLFHFGEQGGNEEHLFLWLPTLLSVFYKVCNELD